MLEYILFYMLHMGLFAFAGFFYGRKKGYTEGVTMMGETAREVVEEEMKNQLIGRMEMFSRNIKEAAYELRKVDKEGERMAQEGQGMPQKPHL